MSELKVKGWTAYVCFGEYAGFHFRCEWKLKEFGICLGWVAISSVGIDLEKTFHNVVERMVEERENK